MHKVTEKNKKVGEGHKFDWKKFDMDKFFSDTDKLARKLRDAKSGIFVGNERDRL